MMKKYQLPNDLNVILVESHKSPVVSVQMWVNTGSADEQKGEEGISHFIEHLVFKGSEKYKVGEIASTVEGSGGELNAYTSFDNTVFYVTISKQYQDVALDVISEMMGRPLFDAKEIDNEREVVIEEIKRGNDSPGRQSSQLLFAGAYNKHAYGRPVIGYDKVIKKVSKKTLVNYYQSRYVPQNMTLVVVGDFESKEMKGKVKDFFGGFKNFKLRKVKRVKEPMQKKAKVMTKSAPFQETYMNLAFRIPSVKHKDVPALDILSMILGGAESARLIADLRNKKGLVNAVGCSAFTPKDDGIFVVTTMFNPEKLSEVLMGLKENLLQALTVPASEGELQRALVGLEAEEFFSLETVDGIASKVGTYETLMKDPNYFQKYMKQVYALNPESLLRVARKYFTPTNLTVTLLDQKADPAKKAEINKFIKEYEKEFKLALKKKTKFPKIKKAKLPKIQTDSPKHNQVEKMMLKNGVKLLLYPTSQTPTVSVQAAFLGGARAEMTSESGLGTLFASSWLSGTKNLSEHELHQKIESMAARMGGFSGRNSMGMRMSVLSPFADQALDLFLELLLHPQISAEAFERERVQQMESIKNIKDAPSTYAGQIFLKNMFVNHPYGRPVDGDLQSVEKLKLEMAQKFFARHCVSKNLTISICGAFPRADWIKKIEKATAELSPGEPFAKIFPHADIYKEVKTFEELKKEQSHVFIGYKGLTLNSPERYALQLLQSVLSGQGGRLFLELRDKASLAYSVSPMKMEGIETGYFGAYIGCSPEKVGKSIMMLKEEFDKVVKQKISTAELDRAKRYLVGRHDIDLQRNSSLAGAFLFDEIYGISYQETFDFPEKIRAVTAEQIQSLAKKIFSQASVTTVVGAQNPW